MDIWSKVGDKMQTITKIQDDTYIMKNDELVSKRGYYSLYWLINFLNLIYLLVSNSKYIYGYIILAVNSTLLFFLIKNFLEKALFIFKNDKLEFQIIKKNKIKKKDIFNYEEILDLKVRKFTGKTGNAYNIEIILLNEKRSYYYSESKEEVYKVLEIYKLYKDGDVNV